MSELAAKTLRCLRCGVERPAPEPVRCDNCACDCKPLPPDPIRAELLRALAF